MNYSKTHVFNVSIQGPEYGTGEQKYRVFEYIQGRSV